MDAGACGGIGPADVNAAVAVMIDGPGLADTVAVHVDGLEVVVEDVVGDGGDGGQQHA